MNFSIKNYIHIWQVFFENITLSLYSQKFYHDVYKNFKGFGVKHFLLCCTVASIINSSWLFVYFKSLTSYFNNNTEIAYNPSSKGIIDSQSLDEIFNKLPQIQYDGKIISLPSTSEKVFYIKSPHNQNRNLVVVDLNNANAATNGNPIVGLTRNEMFINTGAIAGYTEKIPYTSISQKPALLDGAAIKSIIGVQLSDFENNFLYKAFPIIMMINIYYSFGQNILLILMAALFVQFKLKKDGKDGFRVAMFAISPMVLLRAIIKVFIPSIAFVEYYSIFLAFLASRAIVMSQNKH